MLPVKGLEGIDTFRKSILFCNANRLTLDENLVERIINP